MDLLRQAGAAAILVILTLSFQSAGMAALIHWAKARFARSIHVGPLYSAVFMIGFTVAMMVFHTLEILLWAGFYRRCCLISWESSFYFSASSYSTVGYADVALPHLWRSLGPIEAVTGVLMCGLSVSLLFAIVTRLVGRENALSKESQTLSVVNAFSK